MSVTFKKSSFLSFVARYFLDDSGYLKRAGESSVFAGLWRKSRRSEQRNLTEPNYRLIMTLIRKTQVIYIMPCAKIFKDSINKEIQYEL